MSPERSATVIAAIKLSWAARIMTVRLSIEPGDTLSDMVWAMTVATNNHRTAWARIDQRGNGPGKYWDIDLAPWIA